MQIDPGAPCVGKRIEQLSLPGSARLISVMRNGKAEIAVGNTSLEAGDQVLAILEPGNEDELRRVLLEALTCVHGGRHRRWVAARVRVRRVGSAERAGAEQLRAPASLQPFGAVGRDRAAVGPHAPVRGRAGRPNSGRAAGRLLARAFLDIRGRVVSGGEQGLLGLAFHPNYGRNRRFYVNYTDRRRNTNVVEYRANRTSTAALPRTARRLLFVPQPYANHNGGGLAFGPDGLLYVGMGDGGSGGDPENRAQNMRTLLGKLVAINVNARRPAPRIAALGLRNPWRFTFDRANGDLYVGDVGQNAWEEINYVPRRSPGLENYGWDAWEGRARFEQKATPTGPDRLPDRGLQPQPGVLGHGRRRLPRQRRARRARPLLLRRLLQRHDLEPARGQRSRDRRAAGGVPDRGALVVRPGRGRRDVRDVARGGVYRLVPSCALSRCAGGAAPAAPAGRARRTRAPAATRSARRSPRSSAAACPASRGGG